MIVGPLDRSVPSNTPSEGINERKNNPLGLGAPELIVKLCN